MDTLIIENLSKKFGSEEVIKQVSLSVPEHCVFGFLGENGAGKTTMMKLILGLLKSDNGVIKVLGEPVSFGETKTNKYIGYLPDVPEFYGFMNPREYLKLCGEISGLSKYEIKNRSEELLDIVGLIDIKKRISGFSRGMKQRLGIAQALINKPKLLICDEPTSALDPMGRKEILDILREVKKNTTILFSTHILSDVERICDRIAIIHKGSLAMIGTLDEIRRKGRRNKLNILFKTRGELDRFIGNEEIKSIISQIEVNDQNIIIQTEEIDKVERKVIEVVYKEKILPVKLEIAEPTLEDLFIEVIK